MLKKSLVVRALFIFVIISILAFLTLTFSAKPFENLEANSNFKVSQTYKPVPLNPEEIPIYIVKENQSIFDIAKELNDSIYELLAYNHITGFTPLETGQRLFIPRRAVRLMNQKSYISNNPQLPTRVTITASRMYGKAPLSVRFNAPVIDLNKYSYIWDFGNNRFSFEKSPEYLYTRAGTFAASLIIFDKNYNQVQSNNIFIRIPKIKSDYTGPDYITLDRKGDVLNLQGRMKDQLGLPVQIQPGAQITQSYPLIRQIDTDKFIADDVGYSDITIQQGDSFYQFYLFVSPFPSRHSVEPEFDWYFTQYDTGMYGNCGPASNSIAVKWATGQSFSVEAIREEIGMPYENGGVDYHNLQANLRRHYLKSEIIALDGVEHIFRIIDQGKIIISVFHCGYITPTEGDETRVFTGRYYPDSTGHYIVIKGYSLDKKYVIVYDAIPGDWSSNSLRYLDGVSMIGRNRYFLVEDLMNSFRRPEVLVIERPLSH